MITIPLRPVLAYLIRHGVSPDVLEGAPYSMGGTVLSAWNGRPYETLDDVPEKYVLYLGTGPVCPAAMGWAQRLLAVARGPDADGMWIESGCVELWTIGREDADHRWMWDKRIDSAEETYERTYLPGPPPSSPAERLRAVLVYEMGRA